MNQRSKADPIQIQQMTFNEEAKAMRVDLIPTEMNVNLDHRDGDSVYTVKRMIVVHAVAGDMIDTSEVENICRVTGMIDSVDVVIDETVLSDALKLPLMTVKEICVPVIKVKEDCILVLRG